MDEIVVIAASVGVPHRLASTRFRASFLAQPKSRPAADPLFVSAAKVHGPQFWALVSAAAH
jgi:hypothetical protein